MASKSAQGLPELYLATDTLPRNRGRGPGWQRLLNAAAVDQTRVFTKHAAEVRLNAPKRLQRRHPGSRPGLPSGKGGGGDGGGGGGGGGEGGGGGCRGGSGDAVAVATPAAHV